MERPTTNESVDLEEAVRKSHYRAIFLSDIHLGTRGCQADRLVAFLKAHTCDVIYLVGDIVDGWRLRSNFYWPQAHNNVVRRFLTLVRRGSKLVYVTGNHDEFLRRYTGTVLGDISIVDQARHTTADGKRLLVIHGDQFDVVTRYHRWIAFLGDIGYNLLLRLNRYFNWLRRRFGYGYWSLAAWVKHRVKRAVNFVSDYEGAVSYECKRRGYDGVVCGHIHHAEIRDIDGVRYMNCGDWVESCTALVEDDQGEFRILDYSRPVTEVLPVPDARDRGTRAAA